jgi:hypothetical protein
MEKWRNTAITTPFLKRCFNRLADIDFSEELVYARAFAVVMFMMAVVWGFVEMMT